MGTAWSSEYLQRLIDIDDLGQDIDYVTGTGRKDTYTYNDGLTWNNAAHHYTALTYDAGNNEFVMTGNGEIKYHFYDFTDPNTAGRLRKVIDRFNNQHEFFYTNNKLTTITDEYQREIAFTHNADGYIETITDFFWKRGFVSIQ